MQKIALSLFVFLLLVGNGPLAHAHKYFFGLTELSVNPRNQHIEIIHQFTAHDVENAIAEIKQIHFSSAHPDYELHLQQYVEQQFAVSSSKQTLKLNWVGLELVKDKLIIYQEITTKNKLLGLVVKNALLVDTYAKQINTLNYQDTAIKGTLTFTGSMKIATIKK